MSKIEQKNIDRITNSVSPFEVQKTRRSFVDSVKEIEDFTRQKLKSKTSKTNAFLKWVGVERLAHASSIAPVESIDLKPLKGISNEELISRLSAIDLNLIDAQKSLVNGQDSAEINLGRMIIGENIRRLLIVSDAKNEQHNSYVENNNLPLKNEDEQLHKIEKEAN